MIKDELNSLDDIEFQAALGKETGSMFSYESCNKSLDWDSESIAAFDSALGAVGQELKIVGNPSLFQRLVRKLLKVELENCDGTEEALYYGCYFGELLVRNHGWAWVNDPQLGYVIEKNGKQVQPDSLVLRRLTGLEEGMIVRVYQKLSS